MSDSPEERIKKLVPKNRRKFYQGIYEVSKLSKFQWLCFSSKCISNPFVVQHLREKQKGLCPVCNRFLDGKIVIHHIDYERTCSMAKCKKDLIPIPNPTDKRPGREDHVPDCEKCSLINGESFEKCMDRLALVHQSCHMGIHYYQKYLSINNYSAAYD